MRLRRDAPKHRAGLGSQSSSNAREIRDYAYTERRVSGYAGLRKGRAHARRAPSGSHPLAECRRPVEYIVGGLLALGSGRYYHALVAAELGEPALNIRGLVLKDGGRNSRLGAEISG